MPPKSKISEAEIIEAALDLTRKYGFDSINARNIADKLNCSTQPIYWKFKNMDDLKSRVIDEAFKIQNKFVKEKSKGDCAFLNMGLAHIEFSREEKNLYKLLFMSDVIKVRSIDELLYDAHDNLAIQLIIKQTGFTSNYAYRLYKSIAITSNGIAAMLVNGSCEFTNEEIIEILEDTYMGLVMRFKALKGEEK